MLSLQLRVWGLGFGVQSIDFTLRLHFCSSKTHGDRKVLNLDCVGQLASVRDDILDGAVKERHNEIWEPTHTNTHTHTLAL